MKYRITYHAFVAKQALEEGASGLPDGVENYKDSGSLYRVMESELPIPRVGENVQIRLSGTRQDLYWRVKEVEHDADGQNVRIELEDRRQGAAQLPPIRISYLSVDKNGKALQADVQSLTVPRLGESVNIDWGTPIANKYPIWRVTDVSLRHYASAGTSYASVDVTLTDTVRWVTAWKRGISSVVGGICGLAVITLVGNRLGMGPGEVILVCVLYGVASWAGQYADTHR